jgi:predicted flap endonuclease-1-like 5' DNA nuclease
MQAIEANWLVFALALGAALLVGWWLFGRASTAPRRERRPDVLDEGQAPAQRNQALIDAAPAAVIVPPAMAGAMAGVAEIVAVTAQDEVEELEARAAEMEVVPEVPPAPEPEAAPQSEPHPAGEPAGADDLSRIKGLGPKLQALLPTLGITSFAQIAALDDAALDGLDARLGAFAGRPRRDSWVEQATFLAAGDVAGFEAKFGKV